MLNSVQSVAPYSSPFCIFFVLVFYVFSYSLGAVVGPLLFSSGAKSHGVRGEGKTRERESR